MKERKVELVGPGIRLKCYIFNQSDQLVNFVFGVLSGISFGEEDRLKIYNSERCDHLVVHFPNSLQIQEPHS